MKKILVVFLFLLVITSFILSAPLNQNSLTDKQSVNSKNEEARNNNSSDNSNGTVLRFNSQAQTKNQMETEQQLELKERERIILKEGNYTNSSGQRLQMKDIGLGLNELIGNNSQARTRLRIDTEIDNFGRTKLMVNFSNGKNAEIKIMPDTASQTALERLRLRNCNLSDNCSLELKEVGNGNQTKIIYEMQAKKETKILWLFKTKMKIEAQVDAETGDVISTKKPWWSFLSSD